MAHFAKIGKGNIVERVEVVSNDIATTEQAGVEFLQNLYKDRAVWKQTSYNGNIRRNFAGIGWKYDQTIDAFISPQPYPSWTLNETTCVWEAPIEKPLTYNQGNTDLDGNPLQDKYNWNETNQTWDLIE